MEIQHSQVFKKSQQIGHGPARKRTQNPYTQNCLYEWVHDASRCGRRKKTNIFNQTGHSNHATRLVRSSKEHPCLRHEYKKVTCEPKTACVLAAGRNTRRRGGFGLVTPTQPCGAGGHGRSRKHGSTPSSFSRLPKVGCRCTVDVGNSLLGWPRTMYERKTLGVPSPFLLPWV